MIVHKLWAEESYGMIQIIDLLGDNIETILVNNGENKIQIKNLPPNLYFIKLNEKNFERIVVK